MKKTLGIIGVGAFGEFMIPHLAPFCDIHIHDKNRDLSAVVEKYNVTQDSLAQICACDIVVFAVPVSALEDAAKQAAPHLQPGRLVTDVASVKTIPAQILKDCLPQTVDIVGLHPLFGPKSGRGGIAGLNISVCNVRGDKAGHVMHFLRESLALNVIETTPERHDQEMAYSQALTHIIARGVANLNLPRIEQTTKTFALLQDMIDMISIDSDELFRTIQKYNPYAAPTTKAFVEEVRKIGEKL